MKANCIITGINAGVIYSRVIDCVRKRVIRKEITSVTLLLRLDKVLYLYNAMFNEVFYSPCPSSAIEAAVA